MKIKFIFNLAILITSLNGYAQTINSSDIRKSTAAAAEEINKKIEAAREALKQYIESAEHQQPQGSNTGNVYQWRTAPDGFKWLPFEEDGYIGAKNENNQIIVPAFYYKINYLNGFFIAQDRMGIYSIYKNSGYLFLPANDVVLVNANEQDNKSPFILATNKGKWLAISQEGNIIIPEDYYTFIYAKGTGDESYFWIGKDGFQGILNKEGKVVIPLH